MTEHATHENLKILAIVGLTGSGKSTAVEYFTEKGYPKVYFGGVILDAMSAEGIEHSKEKEQSFREEYREKHGKDIVALTIVDQIRHLADAGQHRVIADGLYTWTEYKVLKKAFPSELTLIAAVTPRHLRYDRLGKRAIRPLTPAEAHSRDIAEIENLEKGGPIAIADHYIINDGSAEDFYAKLDAAAKLVEF